MATENKARPTERSFRATERKATSTESKARPMERSLKATDRINGDGKQGQIDGKKSPSDGRIAYIDGKRAKKY